MKLFKKLAAAALAAVLALSMVGCGKASGVNSTKQFILNMLADNAALSTEEYHNTPEMDGIAQKLLTEANTAYQDETQTDKTVKALMKAATNKKGVLKEDTRYAISFVEDYKFKCSIIPEAEKQKMLMEMMDGIQVNGGNAQGATKQDVGVAVEHLLKTRNNLEKILADNSGKTVKQVHKDAERDYWMSAQETLDYGFIDEIMANNNLN